MSTSGKSPAGLLKPGKPIVAGASRGRRRRPCARRPRAGNRGRQGCAGRVARRHLPGRPTHGGAVARADLFRPRYRDHGIPGLGLSALRPCLAECGRGRAAHDRIVAPRPREGPRQAVHSADDGQRRARSASRLATSCRRMRCRSRRATSSACRAIVDWLELNGFTRASTVREPGEYAVRGGILDLYPPGMDMPVRLDFFGDALETIRIFDAQTQRSEEQLRATRPGAGG